MATAVAPIGPVRVAALPWRYRGELQLSVIVKLHLRMRNNAAMEIAEAPPLAVRDRHHADDPTRSLIDASDLVPYRARADVWLTGQAYAPLGRRVRALVARLGVYRQGSPLLEKTVHLVGSRRRADEEPEPFETMPIVYERAYGGAGFDANPVGVGADARSILPNVLDPDNPERPVGFGPVSRYWKQRRRFLPQEWRRQLEQAIPELPSGFDWSYFQAAPEDQQLAFLQGDEWLVLDGMHPMFMRLQTRLPSIVAVARVLPAQPSDDLGDAVALVADTLAIDTDAESCSISWRGVIPVESEQALANMLVAGAVVRRHESVDWALAYGASHDLVLDDKRRPDVSLDRSGVTVVSEAPVPDGVLQELRDTFIESMDDADASPASYRRVTEHDRRVNLRRYPRADLDDETTNIDLRAPASPPSVTEQSALPSVFLPEDHPDWTDGGQVRVRGRIPLVFDPDCDDTGPGRIPLGADSDTGELTAPGRAPLDSDYGVTLPGRPMGPDMNETHEDLPWVNEASVEPLPARPRDPARSLPPSPPIDKRELAASLRRAGASEHEIAAVLQSFDDGERE